MSWHYFPSKILCKSESFFSPGSSAISFVHHPISRRNFVRLHLFSELCKKSLLIGNCAMRPFLLSAWYSSAGMDRILSVFIGAPWAGCGGEVIFFRHQCFQEIRANGNWFSGKNTKKKFSVERKKPPGCEDQRAEKYLCKSRKPRAFPWREADSGSIVWAKTIQRRGKD